MTDENQPQARQFPQVEFSPGGRQYTYHWDGHLLAVGDEVEVPSHGKTKIVKIVGFADGEIPYQTVAIRGLAPQDDETVDAA